MGLENPAHLSAPSHTYIFTPGKLMLLRCSAVLLSLDRQQDSRSSFFGTWSVSILNPNNLHRLIKLYKIEKH